MSTDYPSALHPDLYHPLQYRRAEARWKRDVSSLHLKFCDCGNYINHFKLPCLSGKGDGEGQEEADGGAAGGNSTGGDITGHTGGGEGDITDQELLL
uniref:ORF2 n=1 Tax=Torque teno Leptonychotes weddellii virus-1 TaxID=2012676 RepID=A0A1Z2RVC8_9VIRU|nr:ORF2 [Torque teno Leptonychotes weddellii virus 1]